MATLAQKLARVSAGASVRALSRSTIEVDLSVTATANTDIVVPMPVGARVLSLRTVTNTAFTAATDAQISIGNVAGGAQYVAATTIKAVGVKNHTLVDAAAADYQGIPQDLFVRIAQSGSTTAVGAAKLYVDFALQA